jgi:membrane protease YdiL (CAAX protease family)
MVPVQPLPVLLLAWAAGSTLWFLKGDLGSYRRLRWNAPTAERRRRYRLLAARIAIGFGLPALGALALLGRLDAPWVRPPEFESLAALLPGGASVESLAMGAAAGLVLGTALAILAVRRGRTPFMVGRIGAILPRDRGELPFAALVALTAAVAEEAFFRLMLPLIVALAGGVVGGSGAVAGFALSSLLFAALHRYQGWAGMAATGLFGLLLAWLYLASGAFWLAVAVHLAVDLNGLVARPVLVALFVRRAP